MVNRQELRTMIRLRLGDVAETPVLTDAQLNQWINDSIREYSNHFPRLAEVHIACSAGVREYSLNGRMDESGVAVSGADAVLRVEYPLGEKPPRILLRRSEMDSRFIGKNCYNLRNDLPVTLVLGSVPKGMEVLSVWITCAHSLLAQDADEISLPEHHLELIILFTRLLALQELAMGEAVDPSPTGVILTGLNSMAARAKQDYETTLAVYINCSSPGGSISKWENSCPLLRRSF